MRARLFVALPLTDRVSARLGEEVERLRMAGPGVQWVSPERMHITLRFVGEVDVRETVLITQALTAIAKASHPLDLVIKGIGSFPEEGRPRVIIARVVGVDDAAGAALEELRRTVDTALRELGHRPEKGGFAPHVTLGRVTASAEVAELVERMGPARRREFAHFSVRSMVLFETSEAYGQPVYIPLHTVPLGRG